jgi:Tfp pilus assembly protein PilO
MSPPGRPKGEYRKAQPEGTPVSLLHALLDRVGGVGLAGLGALLAALLLAGLSLPLQRQRDDLQAALQQHLRAAASTPPAAPEATAAEQLARFEAGFPTLGDTAASIARLQAAARRSGLVLAAGEYRLDTRSNERLQRYSVLLPLRGSYAQLRRFIDAVLTELPHAALDDVELRRDDIDGAELEARLRLTLYLRRVP